MKAIQYRCFSSASTLVQRKPSFSTLNSDDISYFKGFLGEKSVIQDEDRLETVNTDWMHKYKGSSKLLLLPRSTEEVHFLNIRSSILFVSSPVLKSRPSYMFFTSNSILQVSQILRYCNSRCLAVVPQGGNTGLVGGSVPVFDEVMPIVD